MIIKIQRRIIPYFNPWNISFGPFEVKVDPRSDGFENKLQNLLSTFFFLTLYNQFGNCFLYRVCQRNSFEFPKRWAQKVTFLLLHTANRIWSWTICSVWSETWYLEEGFLGIQIGAIALTSWDHLEKDWNFSKM